MGLKFLTDSLFPPLCRGISLAIFQTSGKVLVMIHLFMREVSDLVISGADIFRNLAFMSSSPHALDSSNELNSLKTNDSDMLGMENE